jgi:hypothetical protein
VQPLRVHGDPKLLALARTGLAPDARDPEAAMGPRLHRRRLDRVLADGGLHVLAADRRPADGKVDEDLRAEILADVDDALQRLVDFGERRVFEILGPNAEDQPAAVVRPELGPVDP